MSYLKLSTRHTAFRLSFFFVYLYIQMKHAHSLAMFYNSMCYVLAQSVVGVLWQCPGAEPYLESESSETPSGTQRSKRSEACNYWSPHGLLWGRSGSSVACCSCTLADEEKGTQGGACKWPEELFIIQNNRGLSSIPNGEIGSQRRTREALWV